jgi:hypothetical protein
MQDLTMLLLLLLMYRLLLLLRLGLHTRMRIYRVLLWLLGLLSSLWLRLGWSDLRWRW